MYCNFFIIYFRSLEDNAILSRMSEYTTTEEMESLKKMYCGNIAFEVEHIKVYILFFYP